MLAVKDLKPLPPDWELIIGADTGTYMSMVFGAVCPDPYALLMLAEVPNYRYVSNEIELLGFSVPEWSRTCLDIFRQLRPGVTKLKAWADPNTQFRAELEHYNIHLLSNARGPELRTEITREYMNARDESGLPNRLYFAPWLAILPYEIEHAKWPEEVTGAGKFVRVKGDDHSLDCCEHICSRRPRRKVLQPVERRTFLQQQLDQHRRLDTVRADVHLGRL